MTGHEVADDDLVSCDQAAIILGVKPATVRSWRQRGHIHPAGLLPARGRGGVVPLYKLRDLRAYLATRRDKESAAK